ncbi:outer membrane protein [Limoniibacter endophyticus]|uniref:Outer membrane protein n=1 Tax=Limoniibacter endophyticus TaxID=1565040 RepID=A0A8J3GIU1_9HYPH|nr:outer membrane protein [Limoniibacter endophyticus]GHC79661.1 outer membrane protein [Limoniibacter endophyticus]
MKKILLASVAVFFVGAAHAADVVYDAPPAAPVAEIPAWSWAGGYLGIQGGGVFSEGTASIPGASFSDDFNGGYVGGFVGWNFELGNSFILGLEGDVNYNFNENSYAGGIDAGQDWSYGIRARAGYAVDRALIFISGGWAATNAYVDIPGVGDFDETFNGWSVGAGVDYAFTDTMFGRLEYRYSDFGDKDIAGFNVEIDQHTVGVALGVKF